MWKHVRNLSLIFLVLAAGAVWWVTRPDEAQEPLARTEGIDPALGAPRKEYWPTVSVAAPVGWAKGEMPKAPQGYAVTLYADGLDHPGNLYRLPNGDILVAETTAPAPQEHGLGGWVRGQVHEAEGAGRPANRITLLRDADRDGTPEVRSTYLTGLNHPFGMVVAGSRLFVANMDAVMAYPYEQGALKITERGRRAYNLRTTAPNRHWTRNLAASADGKKLYIAVGSATNVGEEGLKNEKGRAMVIEYDIAARKPIPYAVGMRNPVGLDWNRKTGELWTVVSERDGMGSDLVPDYLARVEFGADYGWPHHYWGGYTDERVQPDIPEKRQYERRPDFGFGAHTEVMGLLFADALSLGDDYKQGVFVARHGSWNRVPKSGYDVVFVPFDAKGNPVGKAKPFLTGFLNDAGDARGRPAMLAADATGALLVSDPVGNRIWRIAPVKGAQDKPPVKGAPKR